MAALQKGNIRKAKSKNLLILAELACRLWSGHTASEMEAEMGTLAWLGYTNIREFGGIIDWPYEVE